MPSFLYSKFVFTSYMIFFINLINIINGVLWYEMDYAIFFKNNAIKFIRYDYEKTEKAEKYIKDYANYISQFEAEIIIIIPWLLDSFMYLNCFNSKEEII